MSRLMTILSVMALLVVVLFNVRGLKALADDQKNSHEANSSYQPNQGLSAGDLEIISQMDFLESLPLISEDDFAMFQEDPIGESASHKELENL